jgi:hypothetical protein
MTSIPATVAKAPNAEASQPKTAKGLTFGDVGLGALTAGTGVVAGTLVGFGVGTAFGGIGPLVGGAFGLIAGGVSGLAAGVTISAMRDGDRNLVVPGAIAGAVGGAVTGGLMGSGWVGKLIWGGSAAVAGAAAGALGGAIAS